MENNKNKNLKIWEQVESTPKDLITKIDAGDSKQLNSVSAINRIKKATEMFGAYGKKWGLKNLKHNEKTIFSNLVFATLDAEFFYEQNNIVTTFEISNSLPIVSTKDTVMQVNFTYRKAIETDTITKALSRLGFNADIYTDGKLVEKQDTPTMELVQVGEDLKKEEKAKDEN